VPVILSSGKRPAVNPVARLFWDNAKTIFQVSLVVSLLLLGYLLYGLFTGQLVNVVNMPAAEQQRVLENIQRVSLWLNISVVVLVCTTIALYYEEITLGYIFLTLAVLFAYGLQFCIGALFAAEAANFTTGPASQMALHQIWLLGILFGVPGLVLILRHLALRIFGGRAVEDLTDPTYGAGAIREETPRALIGAFAKCWQLPFCRETVRKTCPIYHAKTKCWKERVGCMCEQNILHLAMADATIEMKAAPGTASGFVPIGDLLSQSSDTERHAIPTRPGPNGVRLPDNPHLSAEEKAERCRNCIIYNEHQRQKYQLMAPLITLLLPLYVVLNFDTVRDTLTEAIRSLDRLIGNLSFSANPDEMMLFTRQVTSSISVETIIIICLTLIGMTMALRLLEYCVFKIKI